jgi:hypothetical protein
MFNYSALQSYFIGKVGFSQTTDPCVPKIHPTLLSNSIVVNAVANEFLKNETIYKSIGELTEAPEILAKIPLWGITTPYFKGDRVKHTIGADTFVYVALQDNVGETPQWNLPFWETNLSAYLRFQHGNGVSECLNMTLVESNNEKMLPTTISFHTTFERYTSAVPLQPDTYASTDFVGVQISLSKLRNLQFVVNQIGLETDTPQTIRFYVYAQSNQKPLTYFDITVVPGEENNFVWKDVIDNATNQPLNLSYFADTSDVGGLYYIGFYREDVLGFVSIWETAYRNFACSNGSFVVPIIAEKTANKPNLPQVGYYGWETQDTFYTSFNLKVTTSVDYTVNVKQSPQQFYKAIQYQIAVNLLQECRNSDRITRPQANLSEKISKVLIGDEIVRNGYANNQNGLLSNLQKLKENLKINLNYLGGSPFINNFG